MELSNERLRAIIKNAIFVYRDELEAQKCSAETAHSELLREFCMTEEEYATIMDTKS